MTHIVYNTFILCIEHFYIFLGTEVTPETTDNEVVPDVDIEYVGELPTIPLQDPNYHYFTRIFQTFKVTLVFIQTFYV